MAESQKFKVRFFFDNTRVDLRQRSVIKKFIEDIFRKEKKTLLQLNYIFCTDKRIREINRDFLKHDYATDIITFDLSVSKPIEGEIYISTDRVRENAKEYGKSFKEEMLRVIFHGVLHLCGHRDKTLSENALMRKKEDFYIKAFYSQPE